MEVQIISRERIKPSSSTPLHLRTYKLSLLDQCCQGYSYASIILYYPVNPEMNLSNSTNVHVTSMKLQLLKQSLSATLAQFYPYAGRVKANFSVDCSDEGVYFVEGRVESSLNEFLKQTNDAFTQKFIPPDPDEQGGGSVSGVPVAKIQVTTFACGGLVICVCTHHEFGDGATMATFIKSWGGNTFGKNEAAVIPNYDAPSLFPQSDAFPREATWAAGHAPLLKRGKFHVRRFVFDDKAIATLRARVKNSYVKNPTRIEAVAALISKCIMNAVKTNSGSHKPTLVTLVMNLRQKTRPMMPSSSVGNFLWLEDMLITDENEELGSIVCKLKKAKTKVNEDFVKSLQGDRGLINLCEARRDQSRVYSSATNKIVFSSVCNYGLYDIDFGWGKPICVSPCATDGQFTSGTDLIFLVDSKFEKDGTRIEAWVHLLEEDMNTLQHDQELLAFATLNPSPMGLDRRPSTSRL